MSCVRAPGPSEEGPPPLAIQVHHNHPLSPAGVVGTSGLLGLSPGPPLPGMASLGSAGGLRASTHLPAPAPCPLPIHPTVIITSACSSALASTQERWLP